MRSRLSFWKIESPTFRVEGSILGGVQGSGVLRGRAVEKVLGIRDAARGFGDKGLGNKRLRRPREARKVRIYLTALNQTASG